MNADQERKQAIETLAEMVKEIHIAMLTTVASDGSLRSRPMVPAETEFNGDLWFFTEPGTDKVQDVEGNRQVSVVFSSPQDQRYVSISGTAERVDDPRKIEILWNPKYADWFPDDVDPQQLCFLKVSIERAEFWDAATTRMLTVFDLAKSIFGQHPVHRPEHETLEWPETASQPEHSKSE
jgi:general stress protein 26